MQLAIHEECVKWEINWVKKVMELTLALITYTIMVESGFCQNYDKDVNSENLNIWWVFGGKRAIKKPLMQIVRD